jgi:hypothetical protein
MNSAIDFQSRRPIDNELARFAHGRRLLYLRKPLASKAGDILASLAELDADAPGGKGNRASAFRLDVPGVPEMIARSAKRGGLIGLVLRDLHFGIHPRPARELKVALEARRRGIPVAEPMGAMVQWVGPLIYRGFFLTRAMSGMTLWELIRTDDDPRVRLHVLEEARLAIEMMHDRGLFHADLNLHNLFVTKSGESFAVIILDLDKARLFNAPLAKELRRRNANRLIRSAHKLDPAGRFFDSRALSILKVA